MVLKGLLGCGGKIDGIIKTRIVTRGSFGPEFFKLENVGHQGNAEMNVI